MAYFGGPGIRGHLHPSLQAYIDCFLSPPFPKAFPRDGGVWNQDPMLMRDFRLIRQIKGSLDEQQSHKEIESEEQGTGGDFDLEDALEQYAAENDLEDLF